jgi:hypothetical protein
MDKFHYSTVHETEYSNGTSMTTFKIFNKDLSDLNFEDAKAITKWMTDEGIKNGDANIRVGIRALAIDGWKSIKNLSNHLETEADYDEYYRDKVIHSAKFHEFTQFQVFVLK